MSELPRIGPWRKTAAQIPPGRDFRGRLFPSGRQALTQVLRAMGLSRADRVAVPEWSSHCVLSAIGAVATPVPMREAKEPAAVLIYDQWGWPRSRWPRSRWPTARIIHDCVDSADLSYSDADAQVWSLSKVLGLQGGGLARLGDTLLAFEAEPAHEALWRQLAALGQHGIAKEYAQWLPNAIPLSGFDSAFQMERERRRANLDILGLDLPAWMNPVHGPGLCPVKADELAALQMRLREIGVDAPIYNFDFAGDPESPRYERCIALPIHGELAPDLMRKVASVLDGAAV